MDEMLDSAYEKLNELLEVHKDQPMTINHYFMDSRREIIEENILDGLEEILQNELSNGRNLDLHRVSQIRSSLKSTADSKMDMDMVAAEDAFDNMQAFYKVRSSSCTFSSIHLINIGRYEPIFG
jgi:hypothetical protein